MIEFTQGRNINRTLIERLSACFYIDEAADVLITGATGTGKMFLAKAFAVKALRGRVPEHNLHNTRLLLKELVDTRWDRHSTIFCFQVAVDNWVSIFKNTAHGQAIVGRLKVHRYSIELTGDDMRMAHTERP